MNKKIENKVLSSNDAKPVLDEVYVFELKDGKMKQISIGLETIEDANSFILFNQALNIPATVSRNLADAP